MRAKRAKRPAPRRTYTVCYAGGRRWRREGATMRQAMLTAKRLARRTGTTAVVCLVVR